MAITCGGTFVSKSKARRFALPWEQRCDADPQAEALASFPALLGAVTDTVSE
jgi:hypothetical protein